MFGVGSAVCSVADSVTMLIAARFAQGVGAAWLMPCSLALITHAFPEAHDRRRALAIWGGASGIGLASGPILGGILATALGWRAIFLVNVPVAIVATVLLVRHVAETRRHGHPLDPAGQALAAFSLSLLTARLHQRRRERGWRRGSDRSLCRSRSGRLDCVRVASSAGPPPDDRSACFPATRPSRPSVAIGFMFNFCLYGGSSAWRVDLHGLRGLDALETGFAMLPMTARHGSDGVSVAGGLVRRLGEWPVIAAGLASGAAGAGSVAADPADGDHVAARAQHGADRLHCAGDAGDDGPRDAERAAPRVGLAAGVFNTARQTGGALGVAALGALLHVDGTLELHVAFSRSPPRMRSASSSR